MCVYIVINATILQVMLWYMDSAIVLKCNGYGLEFWLAGHLGESSEHWRGRHGMGMYNNSHNINDYYTSFPKNGYTIMLR